MRWAYHLTTRGNRSGEIVCDDCDCETFMTITGDVFARHELESIAYCLMTTHYHHLAETRDENLSAAMERLNGLYARSFNRRHGLRGHVFERRFSSKLVMDEDYLFGCCRYIALNPVKAGLCALPPRAPWRRRRECARGAPGIRGRGSGRIGRLSSNWPRHTTAGPEIWWLCTMHR